MGAKSGTALKLLQWLLRGVQFISSALILGVYVYFLATLSNHNLPISDDVKAVAGISGAAVLYTALGLLLCCLAGLTFAALVAMVLDVAFAAAFIYVAVANKHGAGSCEGYLDTPFGKGKGDKVADGNDGFTVLPSFHTACRLQTACLAVSILAIFFFIFSMLTELALARHHRKEKRFGPSPANNYTSGYGASPAGVEEKSTGFGGRVGAGAGGGAAGGGGGVGLFDRLLGRGNKTPQEDEDNVLPAHVTPDQLQHGGDNRHSYAGGGGVAGDDGMEVNGSSHNNPDDQLYYGNGAGHMASSQYETGYGYPSAPVAGGAGGGYGYGYGSNHGAGGYDNGYAPPPQQYAYQDGTYDRV